VTEPTPTPKQSHVIPLVLIFCNSIQCQRLEIFVSCEKGDGWKPRQLSFVFRTEYMEFNRSDLETVHLWFHNSTDELVTCLQTPNFRLHGLFDERSWLPSPSYSRLRGLRSLYISISIASSWKLNLTVSSTTFSLLRVCIKLLGLPLLLRR
jgi:hypothetical protein